METMQRSPEERRRTARVLAGATLAQLADRWRAWDDRPEIEYLRGPESGLVMVQGRIGGTGDRFNLGEATVTRATVAVGGAASGGSTASVTGATGAADAAGPEARAVGTAYVLGSHPEHAALAAIFDGMLGTEARDRVMADVIEPLERTQADDDLRARRDARATVVDFFTVARENDGFGAGDDEDDE